MRKSISEKSKVLKIKIELLERKLKRNLKKEIALNDRLNKLYHKYNTLRGEEE